MFSVTFVELFLYYFLQVKLFFQFSLIPNFKADSWHAYLCVIEIT